MLHSNRSNFLLRTFRFIGIAPYARTVKLKNYERFLHLIPILLSSLVGLCLTIFLLIFPHFKSLGSVHTIINFSYIWSLFFAILSANCQCHFKKSVYYRVNYRIRQIQNHFREKSVTKFAYQLQRRYKVKVLIIFVLFFASQGLVFVEAWYKSERSNRWASVTASLATSSLRILYPMHIFHVVLHCDILTVFIKNLNLQAQNPTISLNLSNKIEFLKNIKTMHMEISTLVADINDFFGWNLLFLMINSFIYVSYQLYWLFLSLQLQWELMAIIGKIVIRSRRRSTN